MKIAVPYHDGQVFGHFGHTHAVKLYIAEDNNVLLTEMLPVEGSGHGALVKLLKENGVNVLICGGIGGPARDGLEQNGMQVFPGVQGDADEAVKAYLNGDLAYDPNARCSHHDQKHGAGHTCGDHGCGDHDCSDHGCVGDACQ